MEKVVGAALLLHNGKLLIAQRPTDDSLAGLWEFPGGKTELGESIQECVRRELKEEFGVEIAVSDFFADSTYNYGRGKIRLVAFWAKLVSGVLRPYFHSAFHWVTLRELKNFTFAPADVPIVDRLIRERPCHLILE